MKNTTWFGLVALLAFPLLSGYAQTPGAPAPAQTTGGANLSPGAAEVVRLAGSGVGDDVVVAYIQNSQTPFNLTADNVLYLKDIGLSPQVTSAMLSHDGNIRGQAQPSAPAAQAPALQPPAAPMAPAPTAPPPAYAPAPVAAPVAVAAPAPTYVTAAPADVSYFYGDLAPYGTWVSLPGYGWCWQPQTVVIARGWRPYCDGGHWVYSDVGWYWQSDYSWGWAPFHYGRWYQHPNCGWVWLPDRVWGPAWVTWRTGGDVCGWAPLPPHADFDVRLGWRFNGVTVGANFDFGLGIGAFAFVSFGDFCNHSLAPHCLPPARVTTIYHQTTIINNYVVNNGTIVHRGIPIERVTAASRVAVPRATVRDVPAGSGGMRSQTASVVYRPQLRAPAQPARMVAQQVDARHPVIQHAPVAPAKSERPAGYGTSGTTPAVAPRRSATAAPTTAAWSGNTRAAAPQPQSSSRTYQSAPAAAYAPVQVTSTEQWKQGSRNMAGYRSDSGLPAYNNARATAEAMSGAGQTSSAARNTHLYYPKGYHQAAEIRAVPQSDSLSSAGKSADAHSRKQQ